MYWYFGSNRKCKGRIGTFQRNGDYVEILAMMTHRKLFKTKSGAMMSFTTFEDKSGSMEVLVFPSVYADFKFTFKG